MSFQVFQEDLECEGTSKGTGSNFILQPSMRFTLGSSFILFSVTPTLPPPTTDRWLSCLFENNRYFQKQEQRGPDLDLGLSELEELEPCAMFLNLSPTKAPFLPPFFT